MGDYSKQRVVIVGGGISGLAAAERLLSLDPSLEIHLFEAADGLGGVIQTEVQDGFCMELGPDSILSRLPWGIDLCRRIGLESEMASTNSSSSGVYVVCRGRLEPIPPGVAIMAPQRIWPIATSRILCWPGKLRLAAERFIPRRISTEDESLASFVTRRLGREALDRLVQPLAGGIYMGDPKQLSIQSAFPQFVEMERKYGSLIKAGRANNANVSQTAKPEGLQFSMFIAPRQGMSQLVMALADRLSECRQYIRHRVDRIVPHAGGTWQVDFTDLSTRHKRKIYCQGVALALPTHHAAKLLSTVNVELSGLLDAIPYAGCVVANLAFNRQDFPKQLDSFGFVSPHIEKRSVLACTFSSVKYNGRAPRDKILLRAFLGGACHCEVQDWSDAEILQAVRDDLRELLGVRASPLVTRIARWPRSMPQYVLGHSQRVTRIDALVATVPGLELAGNGYRGVGIPHCIHGGQQAAERQLARIHSRSDFAPV